MNRSITATRHVLSTLRDVFNSRVYFRKSSIFSPSLNTKLLTYMNIFSKNHETISIFSVIRKRREQPNDEFLNTIIVYHFEFWTRDREKCVFLATNCEKRYLPSASVLKLCRQQLVLGSRACHPNSVAEWSLW